jgi:hypothetical protein
MKLSDFHTPVPLRDSDYAAIRARVLAEIEHERQRRPLWRFAFAFAFAAAVLVVAVLTMTRPAPAPAPVGVARAVLLRPHPPLLIARTITPSVETPAPRAPRRAPSSIPKKPRQPDETIAAAQPMTIEIHTEDPDVRIIWIVNPETTREKS